MVMPAQKIDPARVQALKAAVADELPAVDAAAREWTQLGADLPPVKARVVGRTGFVEANLAAMRGAFEPLRPKLAKRRMSSKVLGTQIGALLGLLSAKVLGQYVLPLGGPGGGQLVVVGPNVLKLADEHGELADDIRRTVVLHEITHRLQFDATDWLGEHLRGLLGRYLESAREQLHQLPEVVSKLPDAVKQARESGSLQPLANSVLNDEQAEILDEAQGLMSLLEGHGNAAMYGGADGLVADPEAVRQALASRRSDVITKILTAVAGLEMKREQYVKGETFINGVINEAGVEGLNRAFVRPENLPGTDEVADPSAWLARVAA